MELTITLDDDLSLPLDDLKIAFSTRFDRPIKFYDDGFGPLFVLRNTLGIVGIVRARSWETAYEIAEDELLAPIPRDDLYLAYGFDSREEYDRASIGGMVDRDLAEGYSYQSNGTDTGIVEHDLNGEALDILTPAMIRDLEIKIAVVSQKS